jgi:starch synthase
LQDRFGLDLAPDIPLFGAVTRLTWQKGIDLLLAALPGLVSLGGQLVLLGSGESELERGFAGAAASIPGKIAAMIGYDEALAHLIIAASDVVLVPSRFEPCGLTQLYGLCYGALPLVRRTGGLADTVADTNAMTLADGTATGFVFEDGFVEALVHAIQRAIALYPDKTSWNRVMRQAMTRDFSWGAAAKEYAALYQLCLQAQPQ